MSILTLDGLKQALADLGIVKPPLEDRHFLIPVSTAADMLGLHASTLRDSLKDPNYPLSVYLELNPDAERPSHRGQRLRLDHVKKFQASLARKYSSLVRKGAR